jgi:hypothetical protein
VPRGGVENLPVSLELSAGHAARRWQFRAEAQIDVLLAPRIECSENLGSTLSIPSIPNEIHMSKLITAILVRNEKDKYLERVLRRCQEFSDDVLVLDDGSTDGSDRLAWGLGCQVKPWTGQTMWGTEAPARAALWDWAAREAGDGWVLICDADMILHGDPRPLTRSTQVNSWAWVLYDLWNDERYYRCDSFWQGHRYPRPWMFRPAYLGYDTPTWPTRGIHTGHCPQNSTLVTGICDPSTVSFLHMAYLKKDDRIEKRKRYLSQAHQLSPFERAHAESVGD